MFSHEALRLARERIKIDLTERAQAFACERMRIESEFSMRGGLGHSGLVVATRKLIKQEYDVRAAIAWQDISRAIAADGASLSPELAQVAKDEIRSALDVNCTDLQEADQKAQARLPSTKWPDHFELKLLALTRAENDIDFALHASTKAAKPRDGAPATVNIFNPIGVVQTGAGSSAALTQTFGTAEREAVLEALGRIREALGSSSEITPADREAVVAVVQDAEAEVACPTPNLVRLRGALSAIAATIQTLGSARSAYELLRGAAALIGLQLP